MGRRQQNLTCETWTIWNHNLHQQTAQRKTKRPHCSFRRCKRSCPTRPNLSEWPWGPSRVGWSTKACPEDPLEESYIIWTHCCFSFIYIYIFISFHVSHLSLIKKTSHHLNLPSSPSDKYSACGPIDPRFKRMALMRLLVSMVLMGSYVDKGAKTTIRSFQTGDRRMWMWELTTQGLSGLTKAKMF